jgi:hypothetical protein
MSIIFDESELRPRVNFSAIAGSDEIPQNRRDENDPGLTCEETILMDLFRKLTTEQKDQVLSQIRNYTESSESEKKINLLKEIEASSHTVANEKLSDIIRDVVR